MKKFISMAFKRLFTLDYISAKDQAEIDCLWANYRKACMDCAEAQLACMIELTK